MEVIGDKQSVREVLFSKPFKWITHVEDDVFHVFSALHMGKGIGLKKLPPEIVQDLHDILEERQNKPTLITTQLPLKNWNEIIEDPLALDTVVDKLKHGSLHSTMDGESYRKKRSQQDFIDK